LNEREADILRYYFGLNGFQPYTPEEIGNEFGLTRERVRQIKEKAIKKLKNQYRNRLLKGYLGQ
jgi:RNA polymerase primary sigma factor